MIAASFFDSSTFAGIAASVPPVRTPASSPSSGSAARP
ncbi:hypothetical protein M768_07835 [Cellulosimicrobium cellulans F16]|uniref:Uncharacterized protein n=1 Tax=Cellulosimicrobium cellulans F16 TaxID=1350482 RepID=A0A0M0FA13_CELCE|nr:hypothetical protein M768_07835 [Cellulosimicrobium cellulans F16]